MTGYDLSKFFDESMGWVWSAPHSQIYTNLKRMEADGLIVGEKQVRGQKLERTVYSVTVDGHDELVRWVATAPELGPNRDAVFLQAVFLDIVDPAQAVHFLESLIAELEQRAATWQAQAERLRQRATPLLRERLLHRPPEDHGRIAAIKAHVFDGQVDLARTRIAWAQQGIALLGGEEPAGASSAPAEPTTA